MSKIPEKQPAAEIAFSVDRSMLVVKLPDAPESVLHLDAKGVDELIRLLAQYRAGMSEQHPADFAAGQKVPAIRNPRWVTEPEVMTGETLFHIRHSGLGWLHFLIPKPEAAKLASLFKAQVVQPAAPPLARRN